MKKRPNPLLWLSLGGILKLTAMIRGQKIVKKCKITKPSIILSNHTSFSDFVYSIAAVYPHRVNFLAAEKMFYELERGPFLKMGRAIPKSLFQSDLKSVISSFEVLRQNGIVGIFPEGQIAYSGKSFIPPFPIAKFLKKSAVDVFVIQHRNVYLQAPPWSKKEFKGPVFSSMELLFSAEDIKKLEEKEIYDKMCQKLYFSSTEFNRIKNYKYKVRDINGLENMLYYCPVCGFHGTHVDGAKLICDKCGFTRVYDEFGRMDNKGVDEWFEVQRESLHKDIEANLNYALSQPVKLESYRKNRIVIVGNGKLTLNREIYHYVGTIEGKDVDLKWTTKSVQYVPGDIGLNIQIYDNYQLFQFLMEDKIMPMKYIIAGEYFHNLHHLNK